MAGVNSCVVRNSKCIGGAKAQSDQATTHQFRHVRYSQGLSISLLRAPQPRYGVRHLDLALVTNSNVEQSRRFKGYLYAGEKWTTVWQNPRLNNAGPVLMPSRYPPKS